MFNRNKINILVACEESQRVCMAFRERGFNAFSCDIQECSGGHPEWHIQGDAIEALYSHNWELVIAHPPCTFLTPAGASNIPKHPERIIYGEKAADFFNCFVEYALKTGKRVCIENPPPMKRFNLPKYTQIVRPWMFGDVNNKPIALWLFNLPELKPTKIVEKQGEMVYWTYKKTGEKKSCSKWYNTDTANHGKHRSKTFPGIASAMAEQWGECLLPCYDAVEFGYWEYPFNKDIAKCSKCGFLVQDKINNVSEMYKCCPNCLARMDGEEELNVF